MLRQLKVCDDILVSTKVCCEYVRFFHDWLLCVVWLMFSLAMCS